MDRIIEKINAAKSIAVLGHVNADPDSVGSCFAFAHMMRLMGKEAVVYFSERMEPRIEFMGDDYVVYDGTNAQEHDLCVCLDCGDMGRLGQRSEIFERIGNSVSIDHHRTNTLFADENYVDGSAPAAGEMLCRLFKAMNVSLDREAASQLYTAISSDTGGFRFASVTPDTMREAAQLLEFGFDHAEISRLLYDSISLNELKFRAEIMSNIRSFENGRICLVEIDKGMIERYGLEDYQVPNVVDIPRSVKGTEIAVSLKEKDGGVRVNLRSNADADISGIATKFGGGGHAKAAGATIENASLEEVRILIVEECAKVLP